MLVYLGACLFAGIRLAREKQVSRWVIPTSHVIDESVDLAHEILQQGFQKCASASGREKLRSKVDEHRYEGVFADFPHTTA